MLDAPPLPASHGMPLGEATRACADLRDRLDARLAVGTAAVSDAERVALRAEIAALIRTADAQVRAWQALAEGARALPERWKRLTAGAAVDSDEGARDAPSIAPPGGRAMDRPGREGPSSASARSDHLGASTYVAKGWSAFAAADFPAAECAFERALALAPDETETLALLAWARAAGGRDDEALLTAQRVLTHSAPGSAASLARVAIGRVCIAKGIAGEAIEHLTRVVRDDNDRRATLYATMYLGVAYERCGTYDEAVAMLRRALVLGPNLVEARYELGYTHWRAGAREAARAEWRAGADGPIGPWAQRCEARLTALDGGAAGGRGA